MAKQFQVHLEGVAEANRAPERTIQASINPQMDLVELFPQLCGSLGVSAEAMDDYCICNRQVNMVFSKVGDICKSTPQNLTKDCLNIVRKLVPVVRM